MAPAEHLVPQGYILRNRVTHIRGLPVSSSHAFRYFTLSLLLSVDALESGKLDLASGWVFGYGSIWGRLLGLRSQPYLNTLSSSSIRHKLEDELRRHHLLGGNETFEDAWMMTMPSILGNEGINPLTVYFCYKAHALWAVVFEIHNTFGESHIHLLQIGCNEDPVIAKGYSHQWTLRRQFHVSPFNDRSGFYTISIQSPEHSPRDHLTPGNTELRPPLPAVWVRVYTEPDIDPNTTSAQSVPAPSSDCSPSTFTRPSVGDLKLAAYLRSTSALPLNTGNVIRELIKQPLALFLTTPRILYQAWILHFSRHLNVFPRPEPHPLTTQPASVNANGVVPGGGVGWQSEGTFDSYARRIVTHFLKRRVQETGISVLLIPSNPNITPLRFLAPETAADTKILEISYLSSRVYTILFSCPSSEHALLLGSSSEEIFQVSSSDLFTTVFCSDMHDQSPSLLQATLQRFRQSRVPATLKMTSPSVHCLDTGRPVTSLITSTFVLWCLTVLDYLEKTIFQLTGSKFVEGQEPWNGWKRAVETRTNDEKAQKPFTAHGSVRCAP